MISTKLVDFIQDEKLRKEAKRKIRELNKLFKKLWVLEKGG
jgi:hypothetical protein